jgi:hypothetical protein
MSSAAGNVNLHITPSNVLSSGKISFKSGNPVIQFLIGEQDRLLLGSSVRLCGKVNFWSNDPGTNIPTKTDSLSWDCRTGLYSAIDQVVIKSQATHQVIEHIKNYNRMMASYIPSTTSVEDGLAHLSQSALITPNYESSKRTIMDNLGQKQSGNSFCLHLPCGLFNGTQGIPLSGNGGVGGLLVEIHLAPDNNVLFDRKGTSVASTLNQSYYELSDVHMVCEAVEDVRPPGQTSTFEYNSISSYFASINSTNAIINFNLGLSRVLGVFMNFIPSHMINNWDANGMATMPLQNADNSRADIKQIVYTRGGQKYPFMFNLDLEQKTQPLQEQYDPVFVRNGIDAIRAFTKASRVINAPTNGRLKKRSAESFTIQGNSWAGVDAGSSPAGTNNANKDGGDCYTLGVGFDSISNQGISFATESFGVNLSTGLTSDYPHGVYMFAHAKNTLVFGPGGVQVIN